MEKLSPLFEDFNQTIIANLIFILLHSKLIALFDGLHNVPKIA